MAENKMYLQRDNGGYGVLILDGAHRKWYYWGEYAIPADLIGETDEENAEIISKKIVNGMFDDADDFINEYSDHELAEHHIEAYDGLTDIAAVDSYENDNRDCDKTSWVEIKGVRS